MAALVTLVMAHEPARSLPRLAAGSPSCRHASARAWRSNPPLRTMLRERRGDRLTDMTEHSAGKEPDLYRRWLASAR
jgi:hypothetical protein